VSDSTWHTTVGVVLRARDGRLEVLLAEGALPSAPLARGESLEVALARAVETSALAHLEQLETRVRADGDLVTAYLGLARSDTEVDGRWSGVGRLPRLGRDDAAIVSAAQARLRAKLSYTNIGFAIAPETFTISRLRDTYAAALGHPVSATNLQRLLTRRGVIEPTADISRPAASGGRPATVYRFAARELVVTNPFAAFRPRAAS
jgi:8-oxo-dGTP diphosphatase